MKVIYPNAMLLDDIKLAFAAVREERQAAKPLSEAVTTDWLSAKKKAIPRIIAEKQLEGASYADVMVLIRDRDFSLKTWRDRHDHEPQRHNLHDRPETLYDYCQRSGLRPHLAPYHDKARRQSAITIEWTLPDYFLQELMGDVAEGAFVAQLEDITERARAEEAQREAARREELATQVMDKVRKLTLASAELGDGAAMICDFATRHPHETNDAGEWLYPDRDLEALDAHVTDVARYLRRLKFRVRVTTFGEGESIHLPSVGDRDSRGSHLPFYEWKLWACWGDGLKVSPPVRVDRFVSGFRMGRGEPPF
jgi:hypothetical protein